MAAVAKALNSCATLCLAAKIKAKHNGEAEGGARRQKRERQENALRAPLAQAFARTAGSPLPFFCLCFECGVPSSLSYVYSATRCRAATPSSAPA